MTNKRQVFQQTQVSAVLLINRFVWKRFKVFTFALFLVAITKPPSVCGKSEAESIFVQVKHECFKAFDAVH